MVSQQLPNKADLCTNVHSQALVRERAAVCTVHKAALAKIEAGSANFIDVDGETVRMYTFGESFECALPPHWAAHPARSLARRAHPSHPSPLGSLEHC